ncbi:MAG: hypothetical protein JWQ64_1321 [Subtercola sp.]|nr:hypothetical protein [Subtercola sp.]
MVVALTLSALSDGGDADTSQENGTRLAVDTGTAVTLTCAAPEGVTDAVTKQRWSFSADGTAPQPKPEYDDKASIKFAADDSKFGVYLVFAKVGTEDGKSNTLKVALPAVEKDDGTVKNGGDGKGQDQPVEVAIGEWDGPFAYVTLGLISVFALAVIAIAYSIVVRIALPESAASFVTTPENIYVDGRWSARIEALVILLTITISVIMLSLGTWLAAIEVRGRQRRRATSAGLTVVDRGLIGSVAPETITALTGLVKELRSVRGTIMVLIVGGALLAGCLALAFSSAESDRPALPPTPSPTATSTPSPSAPASPTPATTQSPAG